MKNKIIICILIIKILLPLNFCFAKEETHEPSYWETIKNKFEEIKSDNQEKSEQAKKWVEEDVKRIGDWEYKIIRVHLSNIKEIEEKLNALGNDRWECFWVEKKDEGMIFFLKKPKISYLQKIPRGELLKILNSMQLE